MALNVSGVDLSLKINDSPAPAELTSRLKATEVTLNDDGRSGFQMVFETSRADKSTKGYDLPGNALLQPFARVVLTVKYDTQSIVLIDGIVLFQELQPGQRPNGALFIVTGEDVSAMMDLEEKFTTFPGMDEGTIATNILGAYSSYAAPAVTAPPTVIKFDANVYLPVQRGTDRAYLLQLAQRFGYRFYIKFGAKGNQAYWGPPELEGTIQPPLIVDSGSLTNVLQMRANYDSLAPTTLFASVQARDTDQVAPLSTTTASSSLTTLSGTPALSTLVSGGSVMKRIFEWGEGLTQDQATAWAQGVVDASTAEPVRVEGELDTMRYGAVLQPRALVALSGAGAAFNGTYAVRRVTHILKSRSYHQSFVLSREGLNSGGAS